MTIFLKSQNMLQTLCILLLHMTVRFNQCSAGSLSMTARCTNYQRPFGLVLLGFHKPFGLQCSAIQFTHAGQELVIGADFNKSFGQGFVKPFVKDILCRSVHTLSDRSFRQDLFGRLVLCKRRDWVPRRRALVVHGGVDASSLRQRLMNSGSACSDGGDGAVRMVREEDDGGRGGCATAVVSWIWQHMEIL
ncbi:hypothetical protein LR48_Vigan05g087300 [Vigna angularis]|uniref:Uncharacterized protein n=1 Tax=Phaseolus angularis TaxID=3914 RepID=A0A0L9UL30_PHAAN|nr:hypothetical protein LR48_Vigan05g087300 [Vigna angularis]